MDCKKSAASIMGSVSRGAGAAADETVKSEIARQVADAYEFSGARESRWAINCGELMRQAYNPQLSLTGFFPSLQQGMRVAQGADPRTNHLMDEFLDKVDSLPQLTSFFQEWVRTKRVHDAQRLASHLQKTRFNGTTLQLWQGALPAVRGRWAETDKALSTTKAPWQRYYDAGRLLEPCSSRTSLEMYLRAISKRDDFWPAKERAAVCMADHNRAEQAKLWLEQGAPEVMSHDGFRVLADLQVDAGAYDLAQQNYRSCLRAGGLLQERRAQPW